MNKTLLERFISKYSLGDNVTSVVWVVKDNVLKKEYGLEDNEIQKYSYP